MAQRGPMRLRPLAWLAGLGLVGLAGVAWPAARKPYGGELEVPTLGSLDRTDPALISSEDEWLTARQLHETLYRLRPDGGLVPALAQTLPEISADGTELLIRLRPDVLFHDGSPVTSSEVIGSFKRLLRPETGSPHWWLLAPVQGALEFRRGRLTRISGLERINKLSLRIRLLQPCPEFPAALAAVPTAILPGRVLREAGSADAHPSGAGPFRLVEGGEPGLVTLVPFAGHWRGRPYLDQLRLRSFETPRDATLAFELGRVQISWRPPGRRNPDVGIVEGPNNRQVFLVVNPQRLEQFPHGFRRALLAAIDRRSLADYLVGDHGRASDELLVFDEPGGSGSDGKADPAKARAYFKGLAVSRLGLPTMLEFIVRADSPEERAAAERIQVNLVDAGASVYVVPLAAAEYRQRVREGRYDLRLARPLPLVRSAELQLLGMTARIEGEQAVAELLQALARMPHDASREGILRERARGYQARIHWFPLYVFSQRAYVGQRVHGYRPGATGVADLADVWLDPLVK